MARQKRKGAASATATTGRVTRRAPRRVIETEVREGADGERRAVAVNLAESPLRLLARSRGKRQPPFLNAVQFSAWNEKDPNRKKLEGVGFADDAFCRAFAVACNVWCGEITDPTGGATHYHHHRITPGWAHAMRPLAVIGRHVFYASPS